MSKRLGAQALGYAHTGETGPYRWHVFSMGWDGEILHVPFVSMVFRRTPFRLRIQVGRRQLSIRKLRSMNTQTLQRIEMEWRKVN